MVLEMKMTIFKDFRSLILLLSLLFFANFNVFSQSEGEKIFKDACTKCHNFPGGGKKIGPDLMDVLNSERFVNEDDPEAAVVSFVKNPGSWGVAEMPAQPYSTSQIKDVIAYIYAYEPDPAALASTGGGGSEGSTNLDTILIILLVLLFLLILFLSFVKNTVKTNLEYPTQTIFQSLKHFFSLTPTKVIIGLSSFVFVVWLIFTALMSIGQVEDRKPAQPINFSHNLHALDNAIDCNYCHSSARSSKSAGIPSANVCMNCHATYRGSTDEAKSEIAKIWNSFGLDAYDEDVDFEWDKIDEYQVTPIRWNLVHELPDFTYFNHSQHVTVAGLDCAQCHGDMKNETIAKVANHQDLNEIAENIEDGVEFNHPTLSMGWCIDCHRQKEVDQEHNPYYMDQYYKMKEKYGDKNFTVADFGGLECGKCHY